MKHIANKIIHYNHWNGYESKTSMKICESNKKFMFLFINLQGTWHLFIIDNTQQSLKHRTPTIEQSLNTTRNCYSAKLYLQILVCFGVEVWCNWTLSSRDFIVGFGNVEFGSESRKTSRDKGLGENISNLIYRRLGCWYRRIGCWRYNYRGSRRPRWVDVGIRRM